MNYALNTTKEKKTTVMSSVKTIYGLISHERKNLVVTSIATVLNSALNLAVPYIMGRAIDRYIIPGDYSGLLGISGLLLVIFLGAFFTSYIQTKVMGSIAQRMLYTLRNTVFKKLQELPVAFFNQNKTGDLISRINNDTNKLNQFFSQSLIQMVGSLVVMLGVAIFVLSLNWRLGLVALAPALLLVIMTRALSPWVKQKNARNLKEVGGLSAEVQESLNNFKVTVAFNRRDYFRDNFAASNAKNYRTAVQAGLANNIFTPLYGFFSHAAQLGVLIYGIHLITAGTLTVGVLVSFLTYVLRFYDPLRQLAAIWSSFQVALAGWDRINAILVLENDMTVLADAPKKGDSLLSFENVSFTYPEGKSVLHDVSFDLQPGKIYALVGPTGGGKTTTASLMSRLYDPTSGTVSFEGRDIRSYSPNERAANIGVLLQEPFLFTGTIGENIVYGSGEAYDKDAVMNKVKEYGLEGLVTRFEEGLDTQISGSAETMSLGQRQIIAFMRAVIRRPKLLILDEATANIDTVTEQLLEDILAKLPKETTLVIIAHRLNTIERADEIFFVNGGTVTTAGSLDHAVSMLMEQKRTS